MYAVDNCPRRVFVGRRGEQGMRRVQFDVSAWLEINSGFTIEILAIRPGEETVYHPAEVTVSDGVLTWVPDPIDTELAGTGRMLVRGEDENGNVIKSSERTFVIELERLKEEMRAVTDRVRVAAMIDDDMEAYQDAEAEQDALNDLIQEFEDAEAEEAGEGDDSGER